MSLITILWFTHFSHEKKMPFKYKVFIAVSYVILILYIFVHFTLFTKYLLMNQKASKLGLPEMGTVIQRPQTAVNYNVCALPPTRGSQQSCSDSREEVCVS